MTTTKKDLSEIGKCAMSSIREMVAALECDYERLEELRDEKVAWVANDGGDDDEQDRTETDWDKEFPEEAGELNDLAEAAGECTDREQAEQRIHEDPLSIEYRSGWVTDKSNMQAEEVRILLTTGDPAVQIIVELDDGQPHRAYLQVQDWGTPWTDYYEDGIGEVLMTYVGCFCFE